MLHHELIQNSMCAGEGVLTLESGTGMCRSHEPLFSGQSALPSLPIYHQCIVHVPPHFQFLEKFCIFSLVLAKISALKVQIFQIFVPKTPHFSREIRSLDPTFGNPCSTHPPKIHAFTGHAYKQMPHESLLSGTDQYIWGCQPPRQPDYIF